MVGLGGREQLGQDLFVTTPFVLQCFNPFIEPCQRDIVVKVERISDLLVDVPTSVGDLFVARLAGARDLLAQIVDFRRIERLLVERQEQPADKGRFFDRADVGMRECDIGREIVLIDDEELVVDNAAHACAHERDSRHQDQQPDRNAEDLQANGEAHAHS